MRALAVSSDTGTSASSLSGLDKAAALLLAMNKETASRLLKQLDIDEIRRVTRAASSLGEINQSALESIIDEFVVGLSSGHKLMGSPDQAESLLSGALPPDQVAEIVADISGSPKGSIWRQASDIPDAKILSFILSENSQVAAFTLAKLNPEHAASLLPQLTPEVRAETLARMLSARPVAEPVVRMIEDCLTESLKEIETPKEDKKAPARIANIVNRMDPAEMDRTLEDLSKVNPSKISAIKALIFKFEDIVSLGQSARATVFDQVPAERVVLALKGAGDDIKEAILSALGPRARRMVESELATDTAAPAREVTKARRLIADFVLKLSEDGAIELPNATPHSPSEQE